MVSLFLFGVLLLDCIIREESIVVVGLIDVLSCFFLIIANLMNLIVLSFPTIASNDNHEGGVQNEEEEGSWN